MRWIWADEPEEREFTEFKSVKFYETIGMREEKVALVEFYDRPGKFVIDGLFPKRVEDDEEIFVLLTEMNPRKGCVDPGTLKSMETGEIIQVPLSKLNAFSYEDWFFGRKKSDGTFRSIDPVGKRRDD